MVTLVIYSKVCKCCSSLKFTFLKLESLCIVIKKDLLPNVFKTFLMTNQVHSYNTINSKTFYWFPAQTNIRLFNPFAPGDFAEKRVLKLVEWFSGHCHAIKSQNLPQTGLGLYTWRSSDPDAKYQLAKFGHAQKAKFLSSPLFRFSCLIFFSLAGHLVCFILVGRVFRKAFRILGANGLNQL